jgi:hypothetical protein
MTDEDRRCGLCLHDKGLVRARDKASAHPWFCRNTIACDYRAQRRLGIPHYRAHQMRVQALARARQKLAGEGF